MKKKRIPRKQKKELKSHLSKRKPVSYHVFDLAQVPKGMDMDEWIKAFDEKGIANVQWNSTKERPYPMKLKLSNGLRVEVRYV